MDDKNNLMQERKKKLEEIRAMGHEPFGSRYESKLIAQTLEGCKDGESVKAAGRLMSLRRHGKSTFCDLRDSSGKIQVYLKKGDIADEAHALFDQLDIGDFVAFEGKLFKTKTGEVTIKADQLQIMSKSLRPLPEKWHGLKDVETRFRHRYLDLAANLSVREIFKTRSRIITAVRNFLDGEGYLEVETPMMHPIPGGAAGKPFKTHHEALNMDLYMRVAPELYLKKLLVGGFERVYEINKSFRNEGISTRHNPEFTMLEVYTAYHDVNDVMDLTERLVQGVAKKVLGSLTLRSEDGNEVDLSKWKRVSFADLMLKEFQIQPDDPPNEWVRKLQKKGFKINQDLSRTQIINIVGEALEPGSAQSKKGVPVFVTDYFTELCPLAKKKKDNPLLSDRFELYIGGMEVANGYSELNDPLEQRERLLAELKDKKDKDKSLDEDFLLALEHGMPPAGGLGIGIDRLVMVLTQQPTIREVILFPQLKSQKV